MICEMCGKDQGQFFNAKVEGSTMTVCGGCAKYASEKRPMRAAVPVRKQQGVQSRRPVYEEDRTERIQIIVPNFAQLIKEAREKKGLKQEQLAKQLAEKESLLHSLESGKHKPSMDLARKLERHLRISLILQHEEKHEGSGAKKKSGPLTIGDMIKQ